jgi:hypothetical protein
MCSEEEGEHLEEKGADDGEQQMEYGSQRLSFSGHNL